MHFCMAVILRPDEDIYEVMEPFSEECEPRIVRTKAEMIAQAKKTQKLLKEKSKEPTFVSNEWAESYIKAKTDEDLYRLEVDEDAYEYDDDGNELICYNEFAHYDWYEIGGRFEDVFPLKDGTMATCAKISDINFLEDDNAYYKALHFWNQYVEKGNTKEFMFRPPAEVYKRVYGDRETYADEERRFSAYGVLKDGEWTEMEETFDPEEDLRIQRDWKKNFYSEFFENCSPEDQVCIVDCHI